MLIDRLAKGDKVKEAMLRNLVGAETFEELASNVTKLSDQPDPGTKHYRIAPSFPTVSVAGSQQADR